MRTPRTLLALTVLVAGLVAPTAAQAQQVAAHSTGDEVVFTGGGWGHGVGMSQYGAQAMGADGQSSADIIGHYYTGVALSQHSAVYAEGHLLATPNPEIWIGLHENRTSFTFSVPFDAAGGVDLCQNGDGTGPCPKPDATPQPGETWEFGRLAGSGSGQCEFRRVSPGPLETPAAPGACKASISWSGEGQAETLIVEGREYRHGTIRVRQGPLHIANLEWRFHVSLQIPLEDYLLGLREVPLGWSDAALEAQVLTGRTYAVYKTAARYGSATDEYIDPDRQDLCYCHLRSTPVDQNYEGMNNELLSASNYGRWAAAVSNTAGQVITHGGSTIQAFYSSSTGGVTENSEDVWSSALPYTRSVDDPWSLSGNPNATWTKTISTASLATKLGWNEITNVTLVNPSPAASMEVTGVKNGVATTETVKISKRYSSLGLLSPTVIGIAYVSAAPPPPPPPEPVFDDIDGSVHLVDINDLADRKITYGCNPPDNTRFCPRQSVTRGQMAAFLARALKLPAAEQDFFTDDGSSIFENDINRLVAVAGTQLGCSESGFCPTRAITRAEMAQFLVAAMGLEATGSKTFVDIEGQAFKSEIVTIANAGITLGCNPPDNDRYCPDRPVLRQEMASFIMRTIRYLGG